MLTAEEFKGYCKGNAVKYIWREDHKGANIQDLKKAVVYINWAIEQMENMWDTLIMQKNKKSDSKLDKMMKSSKLSTVIKKIFKKKRVKKRDNFVNTKP